MVLHAVDDGIYVGTPEGLVFLSTRRVDNAEVSRQDLGLRRRLGNARMSPYSLFPGNDTEQWPYFVLVHDIPEVSCMASDVDRKKKAKT